MENIDLDKSLDEVLADRNLPRKNGGGDRNRGRRGGSGRGVRKPERTDSAASSRRVSPPPRGGFDEGNTWRHDKYNGDDASYRRRPRSRSPGRYDDDRRSSGLARLKVSNLHYEISQQDLVSLFGRIAPPLEITLTFDRAGRSTGIAYVTYERESDARRAIREFDGEYARGQIIHLALVNGGGGGGGRGASGSLFDRVAAPRPRSPAASDDDHYASARRDVRPSGRGSRIDRYVPGDRSDDDRERMRERRDRPIVDRGSQRRADDRGRRAGGGGGGRDSNGRAGERGGSGAPGGSSRARPRKTVEELDAEMNNYWASAEAEAAAAATANGQQQQQPLQPQAVQPQQETAPAAAAVAPAPMDMDDDDMIL